MKRWILIAAVLLVAMIVLPTAIRDQRTAPASNVEQQVTPATTVPPVKTVPPANLVPNTTVPNKTAPNTTVARASDEAAVGRLLQEVLRGPDRHRRRRQGARLYV